MTAPTIVVVDDNALLLTVMKHLFLHTGYRVVVSPYGSEALELVHRHSAKVLVLDLELGLDSGLEIVEAARSAAATAKLPIIVYSGNPFVMDSSAARLRTLGCTLLHKPFRLDTMMQRVEEALTA